MATECEAKSRTQPARGWPAHPVLCIGVGPMAEKEEEDAQVPFPRGHVQRRVPAHPIFRIDLGTTLEQRLDHLEVPFPRGFHERRFASLPFRRRRCCDWGAESGGVVSAFRPTVFPLTAPRSEKRMITMIGPYAARPPRCCSARAALTQFLLWSSLGLALRMARTCSRSPLSAASWMGAIRSCTESAHPARAGSATGKLSTGLCARGDDGRARGATSAGD